MGSNGSNDTAKAIIYAVSDYQKGDRASQIADLDLEQYQRLLENLEKANLYFGGAQKIPEWLDEHMDSAKGGKAASYATCIHLLNINGDMRYMINYIIYMWSIRLYATL